MQYSLSVVLIKCMSALYSSTLLCVFLSFTLDRLDLSLIVENESAVKFSMQIAFADKMWTLYSLSLSHTKRDTNRQIHLFRRTHELTHVNFAALSVSLAKFDSKLLYFRLIDCRV